MYMHPIWDINAAYRRKLEMIMVNDIEVPKPESEALKYGTQYWVPHTYTKDCVIKINWENDDLDQRAMARGLVHLTRDAAIAHAKALLNHK